MKHTTFIIAFMLFASTLLGQQEVQLNTEMHTLTGKVFQTRARNFKNVFSPANGAFDNYVVEITSYKELRKLEDKMDPHPTKKYFRVLRIIYGLDTTKNPHTICLMYLPDRAVENTPGTGQYDFEIPYPPIGRKVYLLENGIFKDTTYDDVAFFVNKYQDTTKILYNPYGDPSNKTPLHLTFKSSDEDSASEEITFSFQEINDFVKNEPTVYFVNLPEKDEGHGNNYYKHAIAFSKHSPATISDNTNFAADLGALCPLRCKQLELITLRDGQRVIDPSKQKDKIQKQRQIEINKQ